jgi:hypothetical protein
MLLDRTQAMKDGNSLPAKNERAAGKPQKGKGTKLTLAEHLQSQCTD